MGLLYLRGHTIQEVGGEMMMGLSIYGVAVINVLLYSRFYVILHCTVVITLANLASFPSYSCLVYMIL